MSHPLSSMIGVGAMLLLFAACDGTSEMTGQPDGQAQAVVTESEGIRLTLQTDKSEYEAGEPVVLTFEIKNNTNVRQRFNFSDGCQHDFEVQQEEAQIWNAGHDVVCIQALTSFELEPGEVWMRSDTWDQRTNKGEPVAAGAFDATAVLPQTGKPLETDPLRIIIR